MKKLSLFLSATIALAACTMANAQEDSDFRLFRGDDNCGPGYQLATFREVARDRRSACDELDEWTIARLANGGSMSGPGYRCRPSRFERRRLGHSLCVPIERRHGRDRGFNLQIQVNPEIFSKPTRQGPPTPPTPVASPDNRDSGLNTRTYYKLTTQFRGSNNCLDVYNGGEFNNMTHLTDCADFSGQNWRFQRAEQAGYYRLTTEFRGASMCLDITNGGELNNQPQLVSCANFSGQYWRIRASDAPGYYRLTTQFRGDDMCLDIFNGGPYNNMPQLTKCASFSGQNWQLQSTGRGV